MGIKIQPQEERQISLTSYGQCDCRIKEIEDMSSVKPGLFCVSFETPAGVASSLFSVSDGRTQRLFRCSGAVRAGAAEWDTDWLIGRYISAVWGYEDKGKKGVYPRLIAFDQPSGRLGMRQLPPEEWAKYDCDETGLHNPAPARAGTNNTGDEDEI